MNITPPHTPRSTSHSPADSPGKPRSGPGTPRPAPLSELRGQFLNADRVAELGDTPYTPGSCPSLEDYFDDRQPRKMTELFTWCRAVNTKESMTFFAGVAKAYPSAVPEVPLSDREGQHLLGMFGVPYCITCAPDDGDYSDLKQAARQAGPHLAKVKAVCTSTAHSAAVREMLADGPAALAEIHVIEVDPVELSGTLVALADSPSPVRSVRFVTYGDVTKLDQAGAGAALGKLLDKPGLEKLQIDDGGIMEREAFALLAAGLWHAKAPKLPLIEMALEQRAHLEPVLETPSRPGTLVLRMFGYDTALFGMNASAVTAALDNCVQGLLGELRKHSGGPSLIQLPSSIDSGSGVQTLLDKANGQLMSACIARMANEAREAKFPQAWEAAVMGGFFSSVTNTAQGFLDVGAHTSQFLSSADLAALAQVNKAVAGRAETISRQGLLDWTSEMVKKGFDREYILEVVHTVFHSMVPDDGKTDAQGQPRWLMDSVYGAVTAIDPGPVATAADPAPGVIDEITAAIAKLFENVWPGCFGFKPEMVDEPQWTDGEPEGQAEWTDIVVTAGDVNELAGTIVGDAPEKLRLEIGLDMTPDMVSRLAGALTCLPGDAALEVNFASGMSEVIKRAVVDAVAGLPELNDLSAVAVGGVAIQPGEAPGMDSIQRLLSNAGTLAQPLGRLFDRMGVLLTVRQQGQLMEWAKANQPDALDAIAQWSIRPAGEH